MEANQEWLPLCLVIPCDCPLDTNLDETGVQRGCGADHMDVGSRCGADALQGSVGRGRKGEVFRVSVLGAGAARGET